MAKTANTSVGNFNHLSLPVRDLEEARRFYTKVLGGEVVVENPGFYEVRVGGVIFGLKEQEGGWTGRDAEFPHYAFTMAGENFYPFIEHLNANGVPTHKPWTRHGVEVLMYFRDPSGNLLELYCEGGVKDADKLPRLPKAGGDFALDLPSLNYDWKG